MKPTHALIALLCLGLCGATNGLAKNIGSDARLNAGSAQMVPSDIGPADAKVNIVVRTGWHIAVLAEGLTQVDNLAVGPDGSLYATQERDQHRGRVVRLGRDGNGAIGVAEVLIDGLQRSDGLAIRGHHLFVTEETDDGRVIMVGLQSKKQLMLGNFNRPEGIAALPDGALLLTEDDKHGRLIRRDTDGTVTALTGPLNRPEGITVGPDGTVFIAETGTGRILAYRDGAVTAFQGGIDKPDQLALDPSGGLWVTEDKSDARLLRIDDDGVTVIADHLYYPQGLLFWNGTMLVSEQDRHRILQLTPDQGPQ